MAGSTWITFFITFMFKSITAYSFLDVYLKIKPVTDFCGAQNCNITYAISMLRSQNHFDIQEGSMTRNKKYYFEENTVIRLTNEMFNASEKIYIGILLFDIPSDIQDYVIVEATNVIHNGGRVLAQFSTEAFRIRMHIYKRNEKLIKEKHRLSNSRSSNGNCACLNKNCACCEHFRVPKIHLKDTVCTNITYISEDIGIRLSLSVDSHVFYSKEISIRNPPPVCFNVPHFRQYASLCIVLYDVEPKRESFSGCVEIEATLYHVRVARKKIGCFKIPL